MMTNYKRPYLTTVLLACFPVLFLAVLIGYVSIRVILQGDLSGLFVLALALWSCYDRIDTEYDYRKVEYAAKQLKTKIEELEIQYNADPADYWKNNTDYESKDLF